MVEREEAVPKFHSFQKLRRSIENVEFSVSELFIVRYQKRICGLTIIFFSGAGLFFGARVFFSSFGSCKRFFRFVTCGSLHGLLFTTFFSVLLAR